MKLFMLHLVGTHSINNCDVYCDHYVPYTFLRDTMHYLSFIFVLTLLGWSLPVAESTCVAKSALYNIICSRFEYWCTTKKSVRTYEVVCRNVSFTNNLSMNVTTPNKVEDIEMYYSGLPTLSSGMFSAYPILTRLYIQNGNTDTINANAFKGATKLDWLILKHNQIFKIEPNAFDGLNVLTVLNMNGNKLTSLNSKIFNGLGTLKYLNLKDNQISSVDENTFKALTQLGVIFLSNNKISVITPGLFSENSELRFVWIQNNNLKTIPDAFFIKKPLLKELLLDNNQINYVNTNNFNGTLSLQNNKIGQILPLGNVVSFNASFNLLTDIAVDTFKSSKSIDEILLNNNQIQNINENLFKGLAKLTLLTLQNNKINYIQIGIFQDLTFLKTLNLSNNQIDHLDVGIFTGLSSLLNLDLSRNRLATCEVSTLYPLKNLQVLRINQNLIENLDAKGLITHLKYIKEISLDRNRWRCEQLPDILRVLEDDKITINSGLSMRSHNVNGISCIAKVIKVNNFYDNQVATTEETITEIIEIDNSINNVVNALRADEIKKTNEVTKTDGSSHVYLGIITVSLLILLIVAVVSIVKKYFCKRSIKFRNMYDNEASTCKLELDE